MLFWFTKNNISDHIAAFSYFQYNELKFYTAVHKRMMLTVPNEHGTEYNAHLSFFSLNILCCYSCKETYQPRTTCRADILLHLYLSYLVIWFWSLLAAWYLSFSVCSDCSSGPWTPDIFRRHPVLLVAFLALYVFPLRWLIFYLLVRFLSFAPSYLLFFLFLLGNTALFLFFLWLFSSFICFPNKTFCFFRAFVSK